MSIDMRRTEASKRRARRRLEDMPVGEKLRILEQLREEGTLQSTNESPANSGERQPKPQSLLPELIQHTVQRHPQGREVLAGSDDEKKLASEVDALFVDRERAYEALVALFPEGVPTTTAFYDRLNDLHMRMGWGEISHRATGLFLSLAIERLPQADGEALLRELPRIRAPFFFQALASLNTFAAERELRAEFAAEWFPALVRRIGNDLASGEFWNALGTYCERHSESALKVLACLTKATDEEQISVAAYILGAVRCLDLHPSIAGEFARLEAEFLNASTTGPRAVYYRSWIQTAWRGKMSKTDLQSVTERMWIGSAEEREQAFGIVSRSILSPSISPECFAFGLDWFLGHVSARISPVAKYHVVDLAAQLRPEKLNEAAGLILAVQPILPEHKGIWQRIEHFLVTLLNRDVAVFRGFLVKLVEANPQSWLKLLDDPEGLDWLLSEMRGKEVGEAVAQLILAEGSDSRKAGLLLFDKLGLTILPLELFRNSGAQRVALAFYELQRSALHGAAIARFLILLIPSMEEADETLRRDFYKELVLQLKNYPGACRQEFERRAAEMPILRKAISEADGYFEALKNARQSSIHAMEVPGFGRAARIERRRFANAVSQGAEEMSVFMRLFKKVRLLYGSQWSSFQGGTLSETSALQEFSTAMEIPRMECIDPEGMNLRRIHASAKIRQLSEPFVLRKENQ